MYFNVKESEIETKTEGRIFWFRNLNVMLFI